MSGTGFLDMVENKIRMQYDVSVDLYDVFVPGLYDTFVPDFSQLEAIVRLPDMNKRNWEFFLNLSITSLVSVPDPSSPIITSSGNCF